MIVRPSAAQSPYYRVAGSLHLPAPFGKITQLAFVTKRQYTPATLLSSWPLLRHHNPCRLGADGGSAQMEHLAHTLPCFVSCSSIILADSVNRPNIRGARRRDGGIRRASPQSTGTSRNVELLHSIEHLTRSLRLVCCKDLSFWQKQTRDCEAD